MYAMRAIGVELVAMFEDKKIKPKRLRELVTLLDKQADALPKHFEYAPNPKRNPRSAVRATIWAKPNDFKTAMTAFQRKARHLSTMVNTTADANIEDIWPALVDTGNSCTACHQKFRIGGDPPHD